jgi:hypothetical protein
LLHGFQEKSKRGVSTPQKRAVAGLNATLKGVSLGLLQPTPMEVKERSRKMRKEETVTLDLLHRAMPAQYTDEGLRALTAPKHLLEFFKSRVLIGPFLLIMESGRGRSQMGKRRS